MKTPILIVVLVTLAGASCFAKKTHAPLPEKILVARTVCIENHGSSDLADKAYDELRKWGRFTIQSVCSDGADLVFVLSMQASRETSGRTAKYDPTPAPGNGGAGTWKYGRVDSTVNGVSGLQIIDAQGKQVLYSDQRQFGNFKSATRANIKELRQRIEEQEKDSKAGSK